VFISTEHSSVFFNLLLNGAHFSQHIENVFDLIEKMVGVTSSYNMLQDG